MRRVRGFDLHATYGVRLHYNSHIRRANCHVDTAVKAPHDSDYWQGKESGSWHLAFLLVCRHFAIYWSWRVGFS